MNRIPENLRRVIIQMAAGRCEYCGLSQEGQEATFHIDHVIPVKAGGETSEENLALACVSCSLRKAARRTAIDPQNSREVPLDNPRRESCREHLRWEGVHLVGLTASGRATVEALAMNRPLILAIRREAVALGRHPSPENFS